MLQKFRFNLKQGQGGYQILPVEFDYIDPRVKHEDDIKKIPFEVKRTYFIVAGDSDTQTGQHAHFEEEEVFLVVKGTVELISLDEKGKEYTLVLEQGEAVYVTNKVWHGFIKLGAGTVLVAFSSTHHKSDRSDYLEDREEYIRTVILSLSKDLAEK